MWEWRCDEKLWRGKSDPWGKKYRSSRGSYAGFESSLGIANMEAVCGSLLPPRIAQAYWLLKWDVETCEGVESRDEMKVQGKNYLY